jgi:hypothetical protein
MARAAKEPWLVILSSAVKEQKIANWRAFCGYFNGRSKKFTSIQTAWRRERDSNPRYGFPYAGFQDRCHQPLGHLSAADQSLSGRCQKLIVSQDGLAPQSLGVKNDSGSGQTDSKPRIQITPLLVHN